jgi:hypothetical protein
MGFAKDLSGICRKIWQLHRDLPKDLNLAKNFCFASGELHLGEVQLVEKKLQRKRFIYILFINNEIQIIFDRYFKT